MKLTKYLWAALLPTFMLAACYEDTGNYDYTPISGITISGIESSYSIIALVDNLVITPTIETEFKAEDLEYLWEIRHSDNTIDTLSYSDNPNLDYPLTDIGNFIIYYYVKNKKNGYYVHTKTSVTVGTEFSQGFYMLKETASGDTDLDLLLMDGRMIENVLERTQGQALGGKPRSLGIQYCRPMIDPDTDKKTTENSLGIITYDNNVNILRGRDMYLAFDNSNLYYDAPAGEILYKFNMGGGDCELFTSNGIYYTGTSAGSGFLGLPANAPGASDYWAWSGAMAGMVFWNETTSSFMYTNWRGGAYVCQGYADPTTGLTDYDCIFMGTSQNVIYALLRKKSDSSLVIYEFTANNYNTGPTALHVTKVDASSILHNAKVFATNEMAIKYLYLVDSNNDLYYVSLSVKDADGNLTLPATKMTASFFPADEEVTFLSHQYYIVSSSLFNHFAVATYKSGKHHVYMYNFTGGLPDGEAVRTASGDGKVKSIRYLGTLTSYDTFTVLFDGTVSFCWTR